MSEELKGFRKIIAGLPKNLSVLDVGAWGLEGDNTTEAIREHFTDVTFINRKEVAKPCIKADYYTYEFDKKFDLIVLDLNIDNNIQRDWEENFRHSFKNLKEGGSIICYAMITSDYGDPETPAMIKKHWKDYWKCCELTPIDIVAGVIDRFTLLDIQEDERRGEIYWVHLR